MKSLRFGFSVVLIMFLALTFSSLASAQATRTWVSGVGDDANPCSRTAPCKTFAGAISKTAPNGIIDCLDPGGFGAVTITKPIMIDCDAGPGGALVAATNAIVINTTGANDTVTLRSLNIDGIGGSGLSGVLVIAGANVHLEDVKIEGFGTFGVEVSASSAVNLTLNDCTISDGGVSSTGGGISLTTSSGMVNADIRNTRIYSVHPGLMGRANSVATVHDSDLSFNGTGAKALEAGATINLIHCQLNNNVTAVQSVAGSTVRVMSSTMSQNGTALSPNGGTLLSDGLNNANGNGSNGSTTGATTKI